MLNLTELSAKVDAVLAAETPDTLSALLQSHGAGKCVPEQMEGETTPDYLVRIGFRQIDSDELQATRCQQYAYLA